VLIAYARTRARSHARTHAHRARLTFADAQETAAGGPRLVVSQASNTTNTTAKYIAVGMTVGMAVPFPGATFVGGLVGGGVAKLVEATAVPLTVEEAAEAEVSCHYTTVPPPRRNVHCNALHVPLFRVCF